MMDGSRRPCPGSPGVISAEVVGQTSVVMCGLAILHLHIQSLNNN